MASIYIAVFMQKVMSNQAVKTPEESNMRYVYLQVHKIKQT